MGKFHAGGSEVPSSYCGLLLESFLKVLGPFGVLVTVLVGCVLWFLVPTSFSTTGRAMVAIVLPCMLLLMLFLVAALHAAYRAFSMRGPRLPRLVYSRRPYAPFDSAKALCLLEPSELLAHGQHVVFVVKGEDGFEQGMGLGEVVNIQEDRRIQVTLLQVFAGQEETAKRLADGDAQIIAHTMVKPGAHPWASLEASSE